MKRVKVVKQASKSNNVVKQEQGQGQANTQNEK
jgi:hypothetical protein